MKKKNLNVINTADITAKEAAEIIASGNRDFEVLVPAYMVMSTLADYYNDYVARAQATLASSYNNLVSTFGSDAELEVTNRGKVTRIKACVKTSYDVDSSKLDTSTLPSGTFVMKPCYNRLAIRKYWTGGGTDGGVLDACSSHTDYVVSVGKVCAAGENPISSDDETKEEE